MTSFQSQPTATPLHEQALIEAKQREIIDTIRNGSLPGALRTYTRLQNMLRYGSRETRDSLGLAPKASGEPLLAEALQALQSNVFDLIGALGDLQVNVDTFVLNKQNLFQLHQWVDKVRCRVNEVLKKAPPIEECKPRVQGLMQLLVDRLAPIAAVVEP